MAFIPLIGCGSGSSSSDSTGFAEDSIEKVYEESIDSVSFFDVIENYDVEEYFPKISVVINSPFSDVKVPASLNEKELFEEVKKILDPHKGIFDSDLISEIFEFKETTEIQFYELWLPTKDGKYRGSMEIDFDNIDDYEDLLIEVKNKASENYDFYQTHPENVIESIINDLSSGISFWHPAVIKCKINEMDSFTLVEELGYLLRSNNHDLVYPLINDSIENININEINENINNNSYMQGKSYKNLKDLVENEFLDDEEFIDYIEIGKNILNLFK